MFTTITTRAPTEVADRIAELADYHGRSRSGEVLAAIALWDTASTLAYLRTPEGEAEAQAAGQDPEAARERVEADMKALMTEMLQPRPAPTFSMN